MKIINNFILRQRYLCGRPRRNNTGKELGSETGDVFGNVEINEILFTFNFGYRIENDKINR
jgi:hypothetical protein